MLFKRGKKSKKVVHKDDPSVYGENRPHWKDLMTVADGMHVKPTEIFISPSGFTKIYYVTALPSTVHFGYLNRFFNLGADVHISIHAEPADSTLAISKRTKMMTKIESEIIAERKAGTNKQISFLQDEYQLLEKEREELRLGIERLFYCTIIFAVSSPDRDEFNSACDWIEREGFQGFVIREAYKEHDLGYLSVAPLGYNKLRHPIEMTSSALANAFPFSNSHFSHEFGVPIGVDFSNGHLNRYDAWHSDLQNHNMIIVGPSGTGKSFTVKGIVSRSAAFGIRHVIIDYEGEYTSVVRSLGGVSIRIDERSPYKFNPFELEEEEEEQSDGTILTVVDLKEKISEMERLVVSMAHLHASDRLDSFEVATINSLMQEMYEQDFGFTTSADSLYEKKDRGERNERGDRLVFRTKRVQPRFSDFYLKLEHAAKDNTRLEALVMRLRRFREDGTEGMFDTYSNVQLQDVPIVHFDLSSLSEKSLARKLGMQVILEWVIENFVKKNVHVKKRVVIDEAQKMLEFEDHAIFLEDVYRRIRKRSGSALAASQDFRKFAENEHGRAIVQNSATKVLLRQDKNDKEAVIEVFGLEEREFSDLMRFGKGQGRWSVNGEVFYNKLVAFEEEEELYKTTYVPSDQEQVLLREKVLMTS